LRFECRKRILEFFRRREGDWDIRGSLETYVGLLVELYTIIIGAVRTTGAMRSSSAGLVGTFETFTGAAAEVGTGRAAENFTPKNNIRRENIKRKCHVHLEMVLRQ
jgi:hypothetical protein